MEIKYLGHSSFLIKTKLARLVTDPFDPQMVGMNYPKTEADIVTVSHDHADHNYYSQIVGDPLVIDLPGEFEKKGARIFGYQNFHDKKKGEERGGVVLYKIETDNLSLLHCGDLGNVPDDSFIDMLGGIDILFIPVGGHYTIDSVEAVSLAKKIEPSIVIPMHYNHERLNQTNFSQLLPLSDFLSEIGAEDVTPLPKLVIKKEDFGEEMKVVTLEIVG